MSLSEDRIILVQSVDQVKKKRKRIGDIATGPRHMLSWWQSWYQQRPPLKKRQQAYWPTCRWSSSCAKTWVVSNGSSMISSIGNGLLLQERGSGGRSTCPFMGGASAPHSKHLRERDEVR